MENIALSFSGGGFRAACFSLGCLSYLDHLQYNKVNLLKNVKYISSTSGGSITNLVYSSYIFNGQSLEDCFAFLTTELNGEKLINRALHILQRSPEWKKRPDKSRNLINAFSLAYDELFAKIAADARFEKFSDRKHQPHLEEICINSTEFTNGLPFRFQSQHPDANFSSGKVGNAFIFFTDKGMPAAGKLKLADILASSSCFPSGFEPLIFPNDYTHENLSVNELRGGISFKARVFTLPTDQPMADPDDNPDEETTAAEDAVREDKYNGYDLLEDESFNKDLHFGIMDGGVADNQAIDAFKLADKRRRDAKKPPFDLFISCDVTSPFMDGYTLPMEKKKWYNRFSPNVLLILWIAFSLILPVMLFTIPCPWQPWMYIVATLSGLTLLPVLYFLIKKIIGLFSGKKNDTSFGLVFNKYKHIFLALRIGALKQMIFSRAKSVFILANDIYLKQIRRMYYNELFSNPRYTKRTIQNAIYDLSKVNFPPAKKTKGPLVPSEAIVEVAEKARLMGTTLWFDQNHQEKDVMNCIIATGRFTTCYNLLKYINKKTEQDLTPALRELKETLQKDWEAFCKDPFIVP